MTKPSRKRRIRLHLVRHQVHRRLHLLRRPASCTATATARLRSRSRQPARDHQRQPGLRRQVSSPRRPLLSVSTFPARFRPVRHSTAAPRTIYSSVPNTYAKAARYLQRDQPDLDHPPRRLLQRILGAYQYQRTRTAGYPDAAERTRRLMLPVAATPASGRRLRSSPS